MEQNWSKIPPIDRVGHIVLGWGPGTNSYHGVIEEFWNMNTSPDRANIFWSGVMHSNLGTTHDVNGKYNAEFYRDHFQKKHPDWTFEVYELGTEECPVVFEWNEWEYARTPHPKGFGVTDKFRARNVRFEMME